MLEMEVRGSNETWKAIAKEGVMKERKRVNLRKWVQLVCHGTCCICWNHWHKMANTQEKKREKQNKSSPILYKKLKVLFYNDFPLTLGGTSHLILKLIITDYHNYYHRKQKPPNSKWCISISQLERVLRGLVSSITNLNIIRTSSFVFLSCQVYIS